MYVRNIPKFKGDNYTHDHEVGIIATLIIYRYNKILFIPRCFNFM